jgi:flagellar protein FlaJ
MADAASSVARPGVRSKAGKPRDPVTTLWSRYEGVCYRLLGTRLDQTGDRTKLASRLKQAGLNVTPGMYLGVTALSTVFATVGVFAATLALFWLALHVPNWWEFVGLITGVTAGAVFGGFYSIVSTRIANRKDRLERELPFSLSELSVLASTGASPIRLVRRMALRDHDPAMTAEFKRVLYKTDMQGKDLITALAETARESASPAVREAFWDLANMIHQGGNLDEYLRSKADAVLGMKRLVQKAFIERLSTFLDMYVALVLVGVLMIAVGAFLINAFGQTAAGLDANELLLLLTFGLVPLAVVMTVMMISIAYARAE